MKRSCVCLIGLFYFLSHTYAQPAGSKISTADRNWQTGGIFYGKTPQQEILAARTEYTKKFDRGNGLIDIIFGGPFHYTDINGSFQDINLDIRPLSQSAFTYTNDQNNFISRFAEIATRGVQMDYKNKMIAFGLMTKVSCGSWNPAPFVTTNTVVKSNTILYKNVYNNIDIGYEVTSEAVTHQMVFKNKGVFTSIPSTEQFVTIEEMVQLPENATLSDNDGTVTTNRVINGNLLININGETIFTIKRAYIWDASFIGDPDEQSQSAHVIDAFRAVKTSVVLLSPTTIRLVASVPVSWLTSPNRVFPVVLDPTVNVGNAGSFSASYRYPFNTCRQQRVSQILFRKSDINAGGITTTGTITDIAFFQNTAAPISNNNVQVKMQEVSWNVMTTPTLTSSGFTTVYGPSTQNFTSGSNVWRTLSLSSPFTFTNTNNLLIEARFSNSTSTSGCNCDNTAPGGHWGWYNSPYAGHRWAYSTGAAPPPSGNTCNYNNSPEGNPAYGYFIPATRITINTTGGCVPVTFSSHPSSQTVVAPAQAQFTVAVSGTTPTYQWEMSTNGGASWGNVPAGAPYSGITTNQLTINPTSNPLSNNRYRCRITNSCTPSPVTSNTAVLTINAAGCATVVTPSSSPSIPAAGGTGSFAINVTPNTCSWSASETLTWVTITSPLSGTGDGTLNYTVAANTGGPRSGTISVNGQNHTINQLGAAAPTTYTISGRVIEYGSVGLPGVTIRTVPTQGMAITDPQGYYSINVPLTYTGILTATLNPYTFTSTPSPLTISSTSFSNKDFDADPVSMSVSSFVIPPWQREGDDYNGSITIQLPGTTTTAWHIEADVYNAGNVHMGNVPFPPTTTNTSNFSASGSAGIGTPQRTLFDLSKNGYTVKYAAVFNANTTIQAYPGGVTKIIDSKWSYRNIILNNNGSAVLKIPIKYDPSNIADHIKIEREGNVAFILGSFNPPFIISAAKGIVNNNFFPTTKFPIGTDGYCTITISNSNLETVLPGDFKITVYKGNIISIPTETQYFDLTKFSKVFPTRPPTNKIIVIIGGIFNEIESENVKKLRNNFSTASQTNSSLSFSVAAYLETQGFTTWYIAQGNGNSVIRNGYDIGKSLELINSLNPSASEINVICHSKGGLDFRAFLQGINTSYANNGNIAYPTSTLNNKIKKVLFLGTPHNGARLADLLLLGSAILQIPGGVDLINGSTITTLLNSSSVPSNISYANLAGYRTYTGTSTSNGLSGIPTTFFAQSDGIVQVLSNDFFHTNYQTTNTIKQLYQSTTGLFSHFKLHENKYLSQTNFIAQNCLSFNFPTNLSKILEFFNASSLSPSTPYATCSPPSFTPILFSLSGSVVSGANIFAKPNTDSVFSLLGTTNEKGAFVGSLIPELKMNDSLLVFSAGYDSLKLLYDSFSLSNEKKSIALLKKATTRVVNPSVSLLSSSITNQSAFNIYLSSQNVTSYQINTPIDQDSLFAPLSANQGNATVIINPGYNKIVIRFIGLDTAQLFKEVFYLPDTLYGLYSRGFNILSPNNYIGASIYINGAYISSITSGNSAIRLLNQRNEIKFIRHGYRDATFIIDTTTSLNLSMQPYFYSSLTDSTLFDFNNRPNPQYWKTITVKNLSQFSNVQLVAKQYDDLFTGMSLKPQTRKFAFRRIGPNVGYYKTAIALDQINTPNKDSVYLLSIKGNRYIKYLPNVTGVTEYDPDVQKVEFDKLDFTSNNTHEIVLMQKQRPGMKPLDTIWHSGQTLIFPIDMFVSDPDSIKNDISASSTDIKVVVNGNLVYVTAPVNFVGTTSFTLTGTHDWLDRTQTYTMKVIPPEVFIPTAFTPNNDGLNDVLKPTFMGKLLYCHFTVYNRWGQKVFDTKDCLAGWNGRVQGVEQPTGTFVYQLTYRFEGTKEEEKGAKGTFTLIR